MKYLASVIILVLLATGGAAWWIGHSSGSAASATRGRGAVELVEFGCTSCHTIPGITGAEGSVGPPLGHLSERPMIAGKLPNTPTELVRWIMHPQAITPGTAMPELGVPDAASRDMAAYLLSR